ncbi:hypothetical protein [Ferruginibacter sp.]
MKKSNQRFSEYISGKEKSITTGKLKNNTRQSYKKKKVVLDINDISKKYFAGLKMIEIADKHPKFEISDEEIITMLKEDENGIYKKQY